MNQLRPRSERGNMPMSGEYYGKSQLGTPLLYFPAMVTTEKTGLVIAGTHGDELAGVVALSCALRSVLAEQLCHHVILSVNPDGCQMGLHSNANGVDLNRNFPSSNWQPGVSHYRWNSLADSRDVKLSTGSCPGSEPETQVLCQLIQRLKPRWIVTIHEPLACIEDATHSPLGVWLSHRFNLPLVNNIGYETPGSLNSWCLDMSIPCIAIELPSMSADIASANYLNVLVNLLGYQE